MEEREDKHATGTWPDIIGCGSELAPVHFAAQAREQRLKRLQFPEAVNLQRTTREPRETAIAGVARHVTKRVTMTVTIRTTTRGARRATVSEAEWPRLAAGAR